ncbi:hypothetical protein LTR94_028908, partial [Friedmanniomyces endolithicus]
MTDEARPEAVDQVEEGIEPADAGEGLRQAVDQVEGARQEGHRHDHEVLHRRQVVELLGPQPRQHPDHAHQQGGDQTEPDDQGDVGQPQLGEGHDADRRHQADRHPARRRAQGEAD